jgi:cytochrome c biogenesis protein CcdA
MNIIRTMIAALVFTGAPVLLARENSTVRFLVFVSRQCEHCQDLIDAHVAPLARRHRVEFRVIDLSDPEGYRVFSRLVPADAVSSSDSVVIRIGDRILGEKALENRLEAVVEEYAARGGVDFPEYPSKGQDAPALSRLTVPGALLAGTLDGVNPCAVSTLVFFMSYLGLLKLSSGDLFKAGSVFILASFFTYYFIGAGLFHAFRWAPLSRTLSLVFFKGVGTVMILLSGLSLYDAVLAAKHRTHRMILRLSRWQETKIHAWIRQHTRNRSILFASTILAVMVTGLEFSCTGQVYFPAIAYALKCNATNRQALLLLGIYNLGFILPLCGVFALLLQGGPARTFASLYRGHIAVVKIGYAIVFLIFGALLLR